MDKLKLGRINGSTHLLIYGTYFGPKEKTVIRLQHMPVVICKDTRLVSGLTGQLGSGPDRCKYQLESTNFAQVLNEMDVQRMLRKPSRDMQYLQLYFLYSARFASGRSGSIVDYSLVTDAMGRTGSPSRCRYPAV